MRGSSTCLRRGVRSDTDSPLPLSAPAFTLAQVDDENLTFSEALRTGALEILYKHRQRPKSAISVRFPALGDPVYGKWQHLSLDEDTLRRESDIQASTDANLRLIDQPGNQNDMELWACLLEFCYRRMGYEGVAMVWQSVLKKKTLRQMDGPLAQAFWGRILSAAVTNDAFLWEVIDYARWLYQEHNVRWPDLWSTVMRYMVPNGDMEAKKILRWHIALSSLYPVDEEEFTGVLRRFITVPDARIQEVLQQLYKLRPHHNMYDLIIPYLYSQGHEFLARQWRSLFLSVNDGPTSSAARPFLRYLIAYHRNTTLRDAEKAVAEVSPKTSEAAPGDPDVPITASTSHNLYYLVNRVHGEAFGIDEKPYNDKLGAKWLASTWVTLDFAISVLHTLGVQEIGPLSLRAIAWREQPTRILLSRLNQLAQWNIRITESNYVRAVRHFATIGDDKTLRELVNSDIHPDVFENEEVQHEVLDSCLRAEQWTTYQLILKTVMAGSSNHAYINSNQVLESSLRQGNGAMALKIMQELRSQNIGLTPGASHLVSRFVVQHLSPHRGERDERQHVDLHRSLCRELSNTRFPPAVEAWRTLLFRLGREGRMDDLERQSLEIVKIFVEYRKSNNPMWACSKVDVPWIIRDPSPYEDFQELPRDLMFRRENHPLRLIFDRDMQNAIIRWGFTKIPYNPTGEARATAVLNNTTVQPLTYRTSPSTYYFARGVRLIAMLRDQGLHYYEETVRKQIKLRLSDLFRGEGKKDYVWLGGNKQKIGRRRKNRLTLAEAKKLCDKAWGIEAGPGAITPSLLELEQKISAVEVKDQLHVMDEARQDVMSQLQHASDLHQYTS